MEPKRYGSRYWCVKSKQSTDGEIYLWADVVELADGSLVFRGGSHGQGLVIFNKTIWTAVYEADPKSKTPLSVDKWSGEVEAKT